LVSRSFSGCGGTVTPFAECVIGQQNPDPSRFEKDIAAFEAADLASPPVRGAVLFVGSSTISYWETTKSVSRLGGD
jgi:hypothetical protein